MLPTMTLGGRTLHHAVLVGHALGMAGPTGSARFAAMLNGLPAHAKVESIGGTLYLDTASIHTPGLSARLQALHHRDFNPQPVAAPFAEPHRSVATPAAGSIEETRANAREALGKRARNTTGSKSERMLAALERARAEQPSE